MCQRKTFMAAWRFLFPNCWKFPNTRLLTATVGKKQGWEGKRGGTLVLGKVCFLMRSKSRLSVCCRVFISFTGWHLPISKDSQIVLEEHSVSPFGGAMEETSGGILFCSGIITLYFYGDVQSDLRCVHDWNLEQKERHWNGSCEWWRSVSMRFSKGVQRGNKDCTLLGAPGWILLLWWTCLQAGNCRWAP